MPIRPENRARYPTNWPDISQRIRHIRAAGRCECHGECGRNTHTGRCPNTNGSTAYGTGSPVVLTVAHLDHTPEHCDDTNLRAMCQGCSTSPGSPSPTCPIAASLRRILDELANPLDAVAGFQSAI